jgi:phage terminase large subunit-like protein
MKRLSKEDYAALHIKEANKYVKDILSKKILANRWVKLACQRHKADLKRKDLYLDMEKVTRAFRFFSLININVKNNYVQFVMSPFQAFMTLSLFGWYWKHNNKRRFRYSFLYVSRKNGKTVFASALAIYALVADGVFDPQALLLASTREQANIALNAAKAIVANSPVIEKGVIEMQYQLKAIKKKKGRKSSGVLKTLASNANRLDGYSPSMALLDEIHSYPDDSLLGVIKSGILARENPQVVMISTAGFDKESFCFNLLETCKNILKGEVIDDSMFCLLYTLDDKDDWTDPKLWVKANPNIGSVINIEDLLIEFNQAKTMPSTLTNFLVKNLNIYANTNTEWIEDIQLKSCFPDVMKEDVVPNLDDFIGSDCYVGIDLSSTRDLTSFVYVFYKPAEDVHYVFPFFFLANNPAKKIRKGGIDLNHWIRQKNIIECTTKTIDYDLLFNHFCEMSEKFNIMCVGYDSYNSALIIPRIESLGIEVVAFPQTAKAFNFPLKYIEARVYENKLIMVNPVLLWHFRNVVLYQDGNENVKIMKNKSSDSVDGVVSLAEAVGVWMSIELSPDMMLLNAYEQEKKEQDS